MSLVLNGMLARLQADRDQRALRKIIEEADVPSGLARRLSDYNGPIFTQLAAELGAKLGDTPPERFGQEVDRSSLFEEIVVYPEVRNRLQSSELPPALSRSAHKPYCPQVSLWRGVNKQVFLTYNSFQVIDQRESATFKELTSRWHSSSIFNEPAVTINGPVVLVQDIFHGSNYTHFLYDWLGRVITLVEAGAEAPEKCTFLMGGFPGGFHRIVLHALAGQYGISIDNFFFPTDKVLVRCKGPLYVFSDLVKPSGHPAQMCRQEVMAPLRAICDKVITDGPSPKRLYISRSDARRRCVANERELYDLLEKHDFHFIRLADYSPIDQIRLFRNAEFVVGPHGMGFAHLGFAERTPHVLELFSPNEGTDAYSFISRAIGCHYAAVIGSDVTNNGNFSIDIQEVTRNLAEGGIECSSSEGIVSSRPENLSSTALRVDAFLGTQKIRTRVSSDVAAPDDLPFDVMLHTRDEKGATADTNVAYWRCRTPLEAGKVYSARCWVYVPSGCTASRITLDNNWGSIVECDLRIRDAWQKVSISRTCPGDANELVVVLRVFSDIGTKLYSCGFEILASPFS